MSNKIHLNRYFALIAVLLIGGAFFTYKYSSADHPGLNMENWHDVHKTRVEGECADCHSGIDYVEHKVVPGKTKMMPAPKSHTDQFLRYTHGKDDRLGSHNCQSCHQVQECVGCHSILPESHSGDFVKPGNDTQGAHRHVALGRADITACYTCHRNMNDDCKECHTQSEISQWTNKSTEEVMRWKSMLNLK